MTNSCYSGFWLSTLKFEIKKAETQAYEAYELLHRPDSWQGFLYIYLLSFPRF